MASEAFIGLIIFSNSLFLSNAIFVRSERKLADAKVLAEQRQNDDDEASTEDDDSSTNERSPQMSPQCESFLAGIFYGFCCGVVRKETCSVHSFRNWRPIRYKLGLLTTSALLLIITALFSEGVLKKIGVDPAGSSPDLCPKTSTDGYLKELREALEDATNFHLAKRQAERAGEFWRALSNDTDLYGTDGYECPMEPRTKGEYHWFSKLQALAEEQDSPSDESEMTNGTASEDDEPALPFFPGHCEAAQGLELFRAREETCTREVCVDSTIEVEVLEVEEMNGVTGAWNYLKEGADGMIKTKTEKKEIRGCKGVEVPCPNNARINDLNGAFDNYKSQRQQQARSQERSPFWAEWNDRKEDIVSKMEEKGGKLVSDLIHQIDVASSAYVVYLCISLFFSAPLYVFRSSYTITVKRYLFGVQKHVFILVVLAVWWGVRYLRTFSISVELQLYMNSLLKDPCYVDADFLEAAPLTLNSICNELNATLSDWAAKSVAIENTMQEINAFQDFCNCEFPCQYLCAIQPHESNASAAIVDLDTIQFGQAVDQEKMCASCNVTSVLIQNTNPVFVGNTTLCDDTSLAKEIFLGMAPETYISGWNLWIQSGLLAMILVKTFVANFGVSALHLADPMSLCNGEFEGPPSSHEFRSTQELKVNCEHNLKMIAVRRFILWGGLANFCLFNIMATTFQTQRGIEVPMSTAIALFLAAFVPPILAYCGTKATEAKILELQGKTEENNSGSDTSCDDKTVAEKDLGSDNGGDNLTLVVTN